MSISISLSYRSLAPNTWPAAFAEIRARGAQIVRLPVRWGDHETTPGLVDFRKAPRLRLERLLQLAREEGLSVELEIGLPAFEDAVPEWLASQSPKTLVPIRIFGPGPLALRSIASPLHTESGRAAFSAFLEEAMHLAMLYASPVGPVVSTRTSLALYEADLGLVRCDRFGELLGKRFASARDLNSLFSTSFRDAEAAFHGNGLRTLLEKRFWLAAKTYKDCRSALHAPFFASAPSTAEERRKGPRRLPILLDPVPVERCGDRFAPFAPSGVLVEEAAAIFHLYDGLRRETSYAPGWLDAAGISESRGGIGRTAFAVLAGSFLEGTTAQALRMAVDAGAEVLFLSGTPPAYDERLQPTQFVRPGRGELRGDGDLFERHESGDGAFWVSRHKPTNATAALEQLQEFDRSWARAREVR